MEQKFPQISIIIINYNTFEMTSQCIESVYEKTKNIEFEIVLVDNASTECNADLFAERFPSVILVKSKENIGFAKGNNLGMKKTTADVILFLNSDTVLENNAVKLCYKKLIESPHVGIITSKLLSPDGNIQHQCHKFDRLSLLLLEKFRIHKFLPRKIKAKVLLNGYFDHESSIYSERIWGTFFMFRIDMLKLFPKGKLADRFFMYGEDYEWCYQVKKHTHYRILYYPEAKVYHLIGGSKFGNSEMDKKSQTILKNRYVCMTDYYGKFKTNLYFFIKGKKFKIH